MTRGWESTHQVEVVLCEIALEVLARQTACPEGLDKGVVDKPLPQLGDIGTFKDIVQEMAAGEREGKERVEVAERAVTFAEVRCMADCGVDIPASNPGSCWNIQALGQI